MATRPTWWTIYDKALLWLMLAFFAAHMINHLSLAFGATAHIALMEALRTLYRFPVLEALLIWGILRQVAAGVRQMRRFGPLKSKGRFAVLSWSGLYLIGFLIIHLTAVAFGRYVQDVDTNLYFASAGYRSLPAALFFYPYYALAVFAAFAHFGSVIWLRTRASKPAFANTAYRLGLYGGAALALIITLLMSGLLTAFDIPQEYLNAYL